MAVLTSDAEPAAIGARIAEMLAAYDAHVAKCPVNNFLVEHRTYGPNERCSSCGSTANSNCGKAATASYALINALRALAKAQRQ